MTPRDSLIKIMTLVIANAAPKENQRKIILFAQQSGLISVSHAHRLARYYRCLPDSGS
jgi:hypothetical protein